MDLLSFICDRLKSYAGAQDKEEVIREIAVTARNAVGDFAKAESLPDLLAFVDASRRWHITVRTSKRRITIVARRPDGSEASLGELEAAMYEQCRAN